jgi:hypothetical protein
MADETVEQMVQQDKLIEMGDCIACKKPWTMTPSEHRFYTTKMEEEAAKGGSFTIPKRCLTCRQAKNRCRMTPTLLIRKVEKMIQQADEDLYTFEDAKLARDLRDLLGTMKEFFGGGKHEGQRAQP